MNGNTELPEEYVGDGEDHVMSFDVQDTVDLAVSGVVTASAHATQNGKRWKPNIPHICLTQHRDSSVKLPYRHRDLGS